MKNFLNYLITIACLFAIPFVANAQRNKQNNTTQEETIIWHTGTYPFTEKKNNEIATKRKIRFVDKLCGIHSPRKFNQGNAKFC